MKVNKVLSITALVVLMVAVSVATSIIVFRSSSTNVAGNGFNISQIPANYAALKNIARAGETDFTLAAELTVNAVVHVKVKSEVRSRGFGGSDPIFEYFFGPQFRQQQPPQIREGAGSGVIISSDGYIVTNNHVIDNSKEIEVVLNNRKSYPAKVVGADPNTDIALLKIEENNLPVVLFGDSDSLKVGEWVLAVGNPFNLTSTVTAGIVSAKARGINILNAPLRIEAFIQTDAAVNPGNSGGALVNTKGELVGINTAIASQTGTFTGYSFAVPSSIVQKVVADMRQFGVVQRAVLGVSIQDITSQLAKDKNLKSLDGVYVAGIAENGAAKKAGIKEGDVITNVNGVNIKTVPELQEQVARYRPGDNITVDIVREGKTQKLKVELKNSQGSTDPVSSDVNIDVLGASFKKANPAVLEKFGLDYGVEVVNVTQGKFSAAGIQKGYIILKINNVKMSSVEDINTIFKGVMENSESNKVLWISGIYPNGKTAYFAVDLGK